MDARTLLNHLVNHPDIRPTIAPGNRYLDAGMFFVNPQSVFMGTEAGGIAFIHFGGGVFDGHFLFTRHVRGKLALLTTRAMITDLFTNHGAVAIVGAVGDTLLHSRIMARAVGFVPYGHSTDIYGRSCTDYILERDKWTFLAESSAASGRQLPDGSKPEPSTGHHSGLPTLH